MAIADINGDFIGTGPVSKNAMKTVLDTVRDEMQGVVDLIQTRVTHQQDVTLGATSLTIPLDGAYTRHTLEIENLTVSATADVALRTSIDNGVSWQNAAGNYLGVVSNTNTSGTSSAAASDAGGFLYLLASLFTAFPSIGSLDIDAVRGQCIGQMFFYQSSAGLYTHRRIGCQLITSVTHLLLWPSTGTFNTGRLTVVSRT